MRWNRERACQEAAHTVYDLSLLEVALEVRGDVVDAAHAATLTSGVSEDARALIGERGS